MNRDKSQRGSRKRQRDIKKADDDSRRGGTEETDDGGRRGDVVVITGASSGIGRATAHRFAERGAKLVLAARDVSALQDVADECIERGGSAITVPTDVAIAHQVQDLVTAAVGKFGRIDVWVGNASVFSYGTFEQTPPEVFRQVMETNLMGQVHGARAVLPQFRHQGRGVLVLVGSVYSKVTTPYVSPYVTAKFGLLGFAGVLRQELKSEPDINVCTVLPATIDTPLYQHAANYTLQKVHPLPPVAGPERVARVIAGMAERPRRMAVVGVAQRSLIPFQALLPGIYDRVAGLIMDTLALRGGSIPGSTGNVFESRPDSYAVTGGWRFPRKLLWLAPIPAAAAAVVVRRLGSPRQQ